MAARVDVLLTDERDRCRWMPITLRWMPMPMTMWLVEGDGAVMARPKMMPPPRALFTGRPPEQGSAHAIGDDHGDAMPVEVDAVDRSDQQHLRAASDTSPRRKKVRRTCAVLVRQLMVRAPDRREPWLLVRRRTRWQHALGVRCNERCTCPGEPGRRVLDLVRSR